MPLHNRQLGNKPEKDGENKAGIVVNSADIAGVHGLRTGLHRPVYSVGRCFSGSIRKTDAASMGISSIPATPHSR